MKKKNKNENCRTCSLRLTTHIFKFLIDKTNKERHWKTNKRRWGNIHESWNTPFVHSRLIWNSTVWLSFLLCHSDRDQQSFMLALPATHVFISSFGPCKSIIGTDGALRRPMTYDSYPFIQSHPPNSHLALKTSFYELN